jgi:hypothetical protein
MRISRDSDSDPCPVPDNLLGELYRANKNGLPELIATVSPDIRAALAMYCYRRGHLKGIGLAIASTCNLYDLETVGGTAGATLYARSREAAPAAPVASQYVARQKITLASGSLRKSLPIDDDVELADDEMESDVTESAEDASSESSETASLESSDDAVPESAEAASTKSAESDSVPPESA